jgi:hypothetical protein
MDQTDLPRIPAFNLRRSLAAAEALAARAEQSASPDLRRLLLKSSCDVLDRALCGSEQRRRPS